MKALKRMLIGVVVLVVGVPVPDYGDQVTLEQQPVDLATVYRDGYAHHRQVVELRVSAR